MKRSVRVRQVAVSVAGAGALLLGVLPGAISLTGVASANTLRPTPPVASSTNTAFTVTLAGATPTGSPATKHTGPVLTAQLVGPRGSASPTTIFAESVSQTDSTARATFDLVSYDDTTSNPRQSIGVPADPGVYDLYLCDQPNLLDGCQPGADGATNIDRTTIAVFGDALALSSFSPGVRARGYTHSNPIVRGSGFVESTAFQVLDSTGAVDPAITLIYRPGSTPTSDPSTGSSAGVEYREGGTVARGTKMLIQPGAALGAHSIRAINPDGTTTTLANAFVVEEDLTLISVAPSSFGAGATRDVTVTGTNLPTGSDLAYRFRTNASGTPTDTTVVSSVVSTSPTALVLRVSRPAATSTDTLEVSNTRTGAVKVINAPVFTDPPAFGTTRVPQMAPNTATMSPASVGRGGQLGTVTIRASKIASSGADVVFGDGTQVTHGAVSVAPTADNENNYLVTVNNVVSKESTPLGPMNVSLVNPDGGRAVCTGCFTINAGPTISSSTPAHVGRPAAGSTPFNLSITGDFPLSSDPTNVDPTTQARRPGQVRVSVTSLDGSLVLGSTGPQDPTASKDGQVSVPITVPSTAAPGAYLVKVTSVETGGGAGSCATCFFLDTFQVASVQPGFRPNTDGAATLTINGSGMPVTANGPVRVTLAHDPALADQPEIVGTAIQSANGSTITGVFNLADVAPGFYSVRVEGKDASGNPAAAVCSCTGGNGFFFVDGGSRPATVSGVGPAKVTQGQQNLPLVLEGVNFFPGLTVTSTGAGLSIVPDSVTRLSSRLIALRVNVASNADPAAARSLRVYNFLTDPADASAISLPVKVAPVLSGVAPTTVGQGATVPLAMNGSNIPSTATFSFPAPGGGPNDVTVVPGSVVFASDGRSVQMRIAQTADAVTGARDVVLTDSETGYQARIPASSPNPFTVTPRPRITSVSPVASPPGKQVTMTISGASFATSGTPTVSILQEGSSSPEAGYSFSNLKVAQDGQQITVDVTIPASAPRAKRTVVVTNPDGGVGQCSTCFALVDVPGAPTVTASPGDAAARVSWTKPADGGAAISGYTVNAVPQSEGAAAKSVFIVGSAAGSTILSGLTNGATYLFTVRANNVAGAGAVGTSAPLVLREAGRLVSIKPVQVVNTGIGLGSGPGRISTRDFSVTLPDAPANAIGAVISATLSAPRYYTTLAVYGAGTRKPTPQVTSIQGTNKSNTIPVSFAPGGGPVVTFSLYRGPANVTAHVIGWLVRGEATSGATGGRYVPMVKSLVDVGTSRTATPPTNVTRYYDLGTAFPDAEAVAVEIYTGNSRTTGNIQAFSPADGPSAASHSFRVGGATTTLAIVRVVDAPTPSTTDDPSARCRCLMFKVNGQTGVFISMVGYWDRNTTPFGGRVVPVAPTKILATGTTRVGEITGVNLPATVPAGVTAVLVTMAAGGSQSGSTIRAYPNDAAAPPYWQLSVSKGDTAAATAIVGVGADRRLRFYVNGAAAAVVAEVVGYIS